MVKVIGAKIDVGIMRKYWYMKKKNKCDIIITSSSRPELLKYTIKHFKKFVHYQGKFRFLLHEDFVIPDESEKVIEYAYDEFGEENVFFHKDPIGLIKATEFLLDKVVTPYVIYLQDDWIFERPVELDRALYIMDKNPKVNLIWFNKYRNMEVVGGIEQPEEFFSKGSFHMLKFHSWSFLPSIWRSDFTKENYKEAIKSKKGQTAPAKMSRYLKKTKQNDGNYIWGGYNEPRFIRHIGENARMESHHFGVPEGVTQESNAIRYMAPWLDFEHIPPRPKGESEKIWKFEKKRYNFFQRKDIKHLNWEEKNQLWQKEIKEIKNDV